MKHVPALGIAVLVLTACERSDAEVAKASVPPAKVTQPIKEEALAAVVLTPEAEHRLGITTTEVVRKKVRRTRTFGGELLVAVARGQQPSIYSIVPGLTAPDMIRLAELQVEADGQVAAAKVQVDAAEIALKRAEGLVAEGAGSIRAVDEAKAQTETARAALQTAKARRELMGAPLFEAVKQNVLWVRVPVYVGDVEQVQRTAAAQVSVLGARTNQVGWTAKPIEVPVSASNGSATVDLYYELENKEGSLRPGQRVAVQLPLQGADENLVIPHSALIYDIHGGTWVYENTAPHGFTRRRVEVRYIANGDVVLARGPGPGTKIVTAGAAELFGAEFGFGK
jgi:hypothetical protein